MADVTSASIIPIPQPRPKTPAERARAYRARKKAKGPAPDRRPDFDLITEARPPVEVTVPVVTTDTTVTAPIAIKPRKSPDLARAFLAFAAFGLAGCGVTMNAMFGHSLGATDASGVLFTALGVAADCAALCLPSGCRQCLDGSPANHCGHGLGRLRRDVHVRRHGWDRVRVRQYQ
jgi:hypothetical protein